LTDTQLSDTVASITLAAPNSALVAVSLAMQNSVTALGQKSTTLSKATGKVVNAKAALKQAVADEAEARLDLQGEGRHYVTLVNNIAKPPADLHDAGLPPAAPRPAHNTPPQVPQQLVNKPPKKGHGKTVVAVYETGKTKGKYVAEQSTDGINYTQLGVT